MIQLHHGRVSLEERETSRLVILLLIGKVSIKDRLTNLDTDHGI